MTREPTNKVSLSSESIDIESWEAEARDTLKHYEIMNSRKMGDPSFLLMQDVSNHMQRRNLDIPNSERILALCAEVRELRAENSLLNSLCSDDTKNLLDQLRQKDELISKKDEAMRDINQRMKDNCLASFDSLEKAIALSSSEKWNSELIPGDLIPDKNSI